MPKARPGIAELLRKLESFHGRQEPYWPTDPYLFLVWWHCGYPASDATCARGWESLNREVGVDPQELLDASPAKLARALRGSGMFPELRAARLKEIAARVQDEFGGDLRAALVGSTLRVRKTLKSFFGGLAPTAAVPSNCTQVVVRLLSGHEPENYVVSYREAQQAIEARKFRRSSTPAPKHTCC